MGPPSSWSDCSVPTEGLYSQQGEGLTPLPKLLLPGEVGGISCLCLVLFLSRICSPKQCSQPFLHVRTEIPSPSHPIPSLLSTETVCIQLIADAMNPKVCRGNFVSGSSFLPASWWGSCQAGEELPAPHVSPFAVWEALTLVSSGWYHFQLQGEMLNIKPVLIGSETASKKETSDCARLNFTLHHSPPFISLPPHSMHK